MRLLSTESGDRATTLPATAEGAHSALAEDDFPDCSCEGGMRNTSFPFSKTSKLPAGAANCAWLPPEGCTDANTPAVAATRPPAMGPALIGPSLLGPSFGPGAAFVIAPAAALDTERAACLFADGEL